MAIFRHRCDKDYTIIPNSIIRNKNLSGNAKAVLGFMLSCNDSWRFSQKSIANQLGLSLYSTAKALSVIEAEGYLRRKRQKKMEDGKFGGTCWDVSDLPIFKADADVDSIPSVTDLAEVEMVQPESQPQVDLTADVPTSMADVSIEDKPVKEDPVAEVSLDEGKDKSENDVKSNDDMGSYEKMVAYATTLAQGNRNVVMSKQVSTAPFDSVEEAVAAGRTATAWGMVIPTTPEILDFCKKNNLFMDESEAEHFLAYYWECDWILRNGKPMMVWQSTLRNWVMRKGNKPAPKRQSGHYYNGNNCNRYGTNHYGAEGCTLPPPTEAELEDIRWLQAYCNKNSVTNDVRARC